MAVLEDELGDILAKARMGQGCTVERVAQAARLTPRQIEDAERYRYTPSAPELLALAEALELSPDKLTEMAAQGWQPAPVDLHRDGLLVEQVAVPYGSYHENCYVIGSTGTGLGAVVDPGGAVDEIGRRLSAHNLTLDLVLITHAHADHIGGLRALAAAWPKMRLASHTVERESVIHGLPVRWEPAKDKVPISLGEISITPLATPGHTPGSTCYLADGVCFVGDTLFAGSIGRPGDRLVYRQMLQAIRSNVLSLPDETIILPGHGPATTVGEENAHNPFF